MKKLIHIKFVATAMLTLFLIAGCQQSQKIEDVAKVQPVDLVYPHIDSANSRWFFFSSACRPFGMVNLSPDMVTNGK